MEGNEEEKGRRMLAELTLQDSCCRQAEVTRYEWEMKNLIR